MFSYLHLVVFKRGLCPFTIFNYIFLRPEIYDWLAMNGDEWRWKHSNSIFLTNNFNTKWIKWKGAAGKTCKHLAYFISLLIKCFNKILKKIQNLNCVLQQRTKETNLIWHWIGFCQKLLVYLVCPCVKVSVITTITTATKIFIAIKVVPCGKVI